MHELHYNHHLFFLESFLQAEIQIIDSELHDNLFHPFADLKLNSIVDAGVLQPFVYHLLFRLEFNF